MIPATIRQSGIFFVVVCMLLLSACGPKLTAENYDRIVANMSPSEVKSILGPPTEIETQDIPLLSTTRYVYRDGESVVILHFLNDKLMTKSGQFGK